MARKGTGARRGRGARTPRAIDPRRRVIAVTGAHAFLGRELCARLARDDRVARVLAIDIRRPEVRAERIEFAKVDLARPAADARIAEVLSRAGVDTVVHLAFLSGPTHNTGWAHELEVIGTVQVLSACAAAGVGRLVVGGTTLVYGPHPRNPNFLSEDHELRGFGPSPFFADKVAVEREVARWAEDSRGTQVIVLRMAPVVGPTVDNLVTRLLRRPVVPALMGYDPLVQLLHERDAVDALALAVDPPEAARGPFNVASEGVLPYRTLIARLGRIPLPLPRVAAVGLAGTLWATQVADTPPHFLDWLRFSCVADTARARDLLGFLPAHDIRAALDDMIGVGPPAPARGPAPSPREPASGELPGTPP